MDSYLSDESGGSHRSLDRTPVGREFEQETLTSAVNAALAGDGGVVVIAGEAGIGKTTMLNWGLDFARSAGAVVIGAQCFDVSSPPPYSPWLTIMEAISSISGITQQPPEFGSIDSRQGIWDVIERSILSLAADQPVVLAIDDLHWADDQTVELLLRLTREHHLESILFVVTYRDDEIPAGQLLSTAITEILRWPRTWRLHLKRLDRQSTQQLVRQAARLPEADERRLIDFLMERSQGNPFFAVEVLQMIIERKSPGSEPGLSPDAEFAADSVPPLVQQVVSQRISALPSNTQELLELASVIGNEVRLDLLEMIYTGTMDDLEDALTRALDRRMLVEEDKHRTVRFGHELIRQTIYSSISPLRRRMLHRLIGETISDDARPNPDSIAEHLSRSGDERALEWLLKSAEQAQLLHAPEVSVQRCQQTLEFARSLNTEPPSAMFRILGKALDTLGDIDGAKENLEHALLLATRSENQRERWSILIELSKVWAAVDYRQTLRLVDDALYEAKQTGDPALIATTLNQLGNCYTNIEIFGPAIEAHHEALAIFEELGDQHGIAATTDLIGLTYVLTGKASLAVEEYSRAIPILRRLDDRRTLITALVTSSVAQFGAEHCLFSTTMQHRHPEDQYTRYSFVDEALDIARRMGWRAGEAFTLALRSRIAHVFGDVDQALRNAYEGELIARRIGHPQWQILSLCSLGDLYLDLGEPARARICFQNAHELAVPTGSQFMIGLTSAFTVSALTQAGLLAEAETMLMPSLSLTEPPTATSHQDLWTAYIKLCLEHGDHQTALDRLDQLEESMPVAAEHAHPAMKLLRAKILQRAGRHDEARALFLDATEIAERFGYQSLLLSIITARYESAIEQNDEVEAVALAERLGLIGQQFTEKLDGVDPDLARSFAKRIEKLLARLQSLKAGPAPLQNDEELTQREQEVLQHVAFGLTDARTAEQLFISPRTVSQHLRSIYARLGVRNRTSAVRVARERGILPSMDNPDE